MATCPASSATRKSLLAMHREKQRSRRPDMFSEERLAQLSRDAREGIQHFGGSHATRPSIPLREMLQLPEPSSCCGNIVVSNAKEKVVVNDKQERNEAMAQVIARLRNENDARTIALPGLVQELETSQIVCDENIAACGNADVIREPLKLAKDAVAEEQDFIDLGQVEETFGGRMLANEPVNMPLLFDNFCTDDHGEEDL